MSTVNILDKGVPAPGYTNLRVNNMAVENQLDSTTLITDTIIANNSEFDEIIVNRISLIDPNLPNDERLGLNGANNDLLNPTSVKTNEYTELNIISSTQYDVGSVLSIRTPLFASAGIRFVTDHNDANPFDSNDPPPNPVDGSSILNFFSSDPGGTIILVAAPIGGGNLLSNAIMTSYTRIGNMVTFQFDDVVRFDGASGTGIDVSFIPARYRPSQDTAFAVGGYTNDAGDILRLRVLNTGFIQIRAAGTAGFANNGVANLTGMDAGIYQTAISWIIA